MSQETSNRKDDHIRISLEREVEIGGAGFKDVHLEHNALPEINKDSIDTSCKILNHTLNAPILIDSITGGSMRGMDINRRLASAAEKCGIGIGVGSQRAALEDEDLAETYSVVREEAPKAFVYGNIGAAQLREYSTDDIERAVGMIDADAMAIHLNFTQEAAQPEGDVDAYGCIEEIKRVTEELSVPVMVKETGCGISRRTAKKLDSIDVDIINTGGKGGTSWPYIESYRADAAGNKTKAYIGKVFKGWGIPTVASTLLASKVHPYVVASGGIRNGLDVAKSVAIGARCTAAALPFLEPAMESSEAVVQRINRTIEELETAMFVTGSKNLEELSETRFRITGVMKEYLDL